MRVFPDLSSSYVLPRLGPAEPVLYAAAKAGAGAREAAAARLLEALAGLAPEWNEPLPGGALALEAGSWGNPSSNSAAGPGRPSPSAKPGGSFGLPWRGGAGGVDAALEKDFMPPYPYSRAFGREEWDWAWRHCQGRTAAAAALLWAAKEAAAKAVGWAFTPWTPKPSRLSPKVPPGKA